MPKKRAPSVEQNNIFPYPSIEAFRWAAIDFVHSLNIGGRNTLDGTQCPEPRETEHIGRPPSLKPDVEPHRCPAERCGHNLEGFCSVSFCPNYVIYRQETNKCETCGTAINKHPKCDACGVLCGPGHLDWLPSRCQGVDLCGHCIASWKRLDKEIGKTTFEQFKNPKAHWWESGLPQLEKAEQ